MVPHVSYDSVQPLDTNNVKHRLRPGCCLQEAFLEVVMKALTDTCKTRGRSPIFFGISLENRPKKNRINHLSSPAPVVEHVRDDLFHMRALGQGWQKGRGKHHCYYPGWQGYHREISPSNSTVSFFSVRCVVQTARKPTT